MRESLRARLLLLHTVAVTIIVTLVGGTLCYSYWRTLVADLDRELTLRAATISGALSPAAPGRFDLALPQDTRDYFRADAPEQAYYGIWTASGVVVDTSDPDASIARPDGVGATTRNGRREVVVVGPEETLVLVGRDLGRVRAEVQSLALAIVPVGLVAVGLSFMSGWLLAGRALAPIARMSRTARAMAEGEFDARVPIDRTETELGQLAVSLNTAFDRMHGAIERQQRFTADASHDLRTPLAALKAEADWALGRPRDLEEYREALATCRTAAARMSAIVEGLLELARADADDVPLQVRRTPVEDVVHEAVALARPVAERRGIRIVSQVERADVKADPERLRQALSNVILNAIHYNHDGGHVAVSAAAEQGLVTLRVKDDGIGIGEEDLPHVFDRFYRADKARATVGGTGLGLALTKWIVERHGGTVACSSVPGVGTEFTLYLPSA
jgi:two-component system, OmpR family, sensor kinase